MLRSYYFEMSWVYIRMFLKAVKGGCLNSWTPNTSTELSINLVDSVSLIYYYCFYSACFAVSLGFQGVIHTVLKCIKKYWFWAVLSMPLGSRIIQVTLFGFTHIQLEYFYIFCKVFVNIFFGCCLIHPSLVCYVIDILFWFGYLIE